ncbi:MAG: transcriptional regulator TbsP domain-containing protein, partial [Natrinema limicola]
MTSNLLNHQIDDILESVLEDASGDIFMVNPSHDAIEEFVSVATTFDGDLPAVQMLADERTLKDIMDDFIVASNAADLISEGALALRTLEQAPENSLLITEDRVVAVVHADT